MVTVQSQSPAVVNLPLEIYLKGPGMIRTMFGSHSNLFKVR